MTFSNTPLYDFRIGTASTQASRTGTISIGAGSKNVVGISTIATTQLHVGDLIIVAGQTLSIAAIADNTHWTLDLAAVAAISGQAFAYNPLTNIEALTVPLPAPKPPFEPYAVAYDLGNSGKRGYGRPSCVWHFGFLPNDQRDQLRTFCPTAYAAVLIRTIINESADAYANFTAKMLWPDKEPHDFHVRIPFELIFRDLVQL
jgi:hypothetical protein